MGIASRRIPKGSCMMKAKTEEILFASLQKNTELTDTHIKDVIEIVKNSKIVGHKAKDEMIEKFIEVLSCSREFANKLYNICMEAYILKH